MTAALLYWVRADLRHRRWAALGLVVLVAVAVVVPLATAAGARRTASSLDRMRAELRPSHGNVQFEEEGAPADAAQRLAAMPGVEHVGEGISILARPAGTDVGIFESFGQGAADDAGLLRAFDRPRLDAGRLPEGDDEVLVSRSIARARGLDIGDTMPLETLSADGLLAAFEGAEFAYDGPVLDLEVVGIGRTPEELTLGGDDAIAASFTVAPAFFDRWQDQLGWFDGIFVFRLDEGVDGVASFEQAVREEFADHDDVTVYANEQQAQVEQAIDAQSIGLALMALVSAVAALVTVGQAGARWVRSSTVRDETIAALGAGSRQRVLAQALTLGVPVVAGGALAVVGAILVSGRFPTGAAGRIEPDPGVTADLVVLVPGALVVAGLVGVVAWSASGRTRPARLPGRPVGLPGDLPVSVVTGLRSTFGGRRGTLTRSAAIAAVAGVAGVVGAGVFGASLVRLTDTPARYGWNWDLAVGLGDLVSDEDAFDAASVVVGDARVEAAMVVRIDNVILDGREEFSFAVRTVVGDQLLTIVDGRAPTSPGEVALGATSLEAMDVSVGGVVEGRGVDGDPVPLRVVGQALFPVVENTDPARGVSMEHETYEQLLSPGIGFPELVVRAVDGADVPGLESDLAEIGAVATDTLPPAVVNLRGVDGVPTALAMFLGVLAAAAAVHALVTALRRRRHELAVLRTLGFVRRQLATTVVVQALAFGVVGLAVGIPLGLGIGRQAWQSVAGGLGFATDPLTPGWTALVVPGVLAVLLLVAALPARTASRTPAATLLRSE